MEKDTTTAPATPGATPATMMKPDFEIPEIPREFWGPLCMDAFKANEKAREAEAADEAAAVKVRELRERIKSTEASSRNLDEDAAVAVARARAAVEEIDRATSREEREKRKQEAASAEREAFDAGNSAAQVKKVLAALRGSLTICEDEAKEKAGMARNLRIHADALRRSAIEREVPSIKRRIAEVQKFNKAAARAAALLDARRHLPRVNCRDCRFWVPDESGPSKGECRARPPLANIQERGIFPTTCERDWCALGEPIPAPPADAAPAADTPADRNAAPDAPADTPADRDTAPDAPANTHADTHAAPDTHADTADA